LAPVNGNEKTQSEIYFIKEQPGMIARNNKRFEINLDSFCYHFQFRDKIYYQIK